MDPFEPTPEEKQAALIQALSGQQGATSADFMRGWGNILGQGGGALGEYGQGQVKQGAQLDQSRQAGLGQALQLALENQRQANTERHQQAQEDLQRRQLEQNKFGSSPMGIYSTRTGDLIHEAPPKNEGTGGLTANQLAQQFENFRKAISPDSTRKLLGQMESAITRADELGALIKDPKTGKPFDLNPQNVREAYTMFAQQAQMGGQPAFGQIEHLVPETLMSKFAELKQKYGGVPVGAGQQEFLQQLLESSARNKAVALAEQRKLTRRQYQAFANLRKIDPGHFDQLVRSAGDDPSLIDESGAYVEPQAQPETKVIGGKTYFKNANGKWAVRE